MCQSRIAGKTAFRYGSQIVCGYAGQGGTFGEGVFSCGSKGVSVETQNVPATIEGFFSGENEIVRRKMPGYFRLTEGKVAY